MVRERVDDPYKARLKLPEPTVCPQCGAVFHEGRWRWASRPRPAHEELCHACHRIDDRYPAGEFTIKDDFAARHMDAILRLARHPEELEKAEHPLHRIMSIVERDGGMVVRTIDILPPRPIGEALHRAYRGELESPVRNQAPFHSCRMEARAVTAAPPRPVAGPLRPPADLVWA